jgi:class 3 adenylate cyclase/cold shock CspA family protein
MTGTSELATRVDDFLKDLSSARVRKTFFFVDLFNSTDYKVNRSDNEWVPTIGGFYRVAVQNIEAHKGKVLKFLGDAVMAVFDDAGEAIQGAIDLQEAMDEKQRQENSTISCKIGISTGEAFEFNTSDGRADYLGVTVDLAARLCDFANGKAILLSGRTYNAANTEEIRSRAGQTLQRTTEDYFGAKLVAPLKGIKEPVSYYALFWQANPSAGYLTTQAVTPATPERDRNTPPAPPPLIPVKAQRLRGTVNRFFTDRGYGFIAYQAADGTLQDIWFHKTDVVGAAAVAIDAIAYFVPMQDSSGKGHATSVVLLKSSLHGQIQRYETGKFGFLSTRDEEGNKIDFFFLPGDVAGDVNGGDTVTFIAAENPRGLCAKHVERGEGASTSSSPHLDLGSTEHGVVDSFFAEKGFGFITCRGNRLFAHVTDIRDADRVLHENEPLEFTVAAGRDGAYRAVAIHRIVEREE